jgi:membrane-bound serine protease (ClpP class)
MLPGVRTGLLPLLAALALAARSQDGTVREGAIHTAELRGIVHPLSAGYLVDAIEHADSSGAALLVIEVDTPGGLVDPTKELVQRMLAARTPIAVFVSPSGARAASAGFLILAAADVAAMAPGTNTGAAHPVDVGVGSGAGDVMLEKAASDLAAFARTLALNRGRNVELAERAVTESASFTEREALEQGVIDLVASDREDLLRQLDGRAVRRFDGAEVVLATRGSVQPPLEPSFVQRWLGPLLRPELVLLLLGVGITGLYVELTHPGLILPGVVGVLCLLLFALAFQILPVDWIGLALIALGLALFLLEIKVVSFGLLTAGGFVCVVLGLSLLFPRDVPALRVPLGYVLPLAISVAAAIGFVTWNAARAQRLPVATGAEGMLGEVGRAATDLAPEGKVAVHGELWNARSDGFVGRGDAVRVVGLEGLTLTVERKESPA